MALCRSLIFSFVAIPLTFSIAWANPSPRKDEPAPPQPQEAIRKAREERRMGHHLLGGAVLGAHLHLEEAGKHFNQVISPSLSVFGGYRTHFRPRLGIKAGLLASLGPTLAIRFMDSLSLQGTELRPGTITEWGNDGVSLSVTPTVQLLLGPLKRLQLEPGLGITLGRHTASAITLESRNTSLEYEPKQEFFYPNLLLGGSLLLGALDQYNVTFLFALGAGSGGVVHFHGGAGFVYAFRLPQRKRASIAG